jgi:pilus assembly protein CpaC
MFKHFLLRHVLPLTMVSAWVFGALAQQSQITLQPPQPTAKPSLIYKVDAGTERIEMMVRTSRILTMDQKVPQAQVNNPEILELTPLSPTQIQISAKATGVTQVNLWGEDQKVHSIDVLVIGDARELTLVLRTRFPNAALNVTPVGSSVLVSGFVDQPELIDRIIRIAEEYYPKVINNMTVGGCQQVLLHVKIMEVSRTKLRRLGFDFSKVTGTNVVSSGAAGLLNTIITTPGSIISTNAPAPGAPGNGNFAFGVINGGNAFFGVLDALREDGLAKVLAEPTLTSISGHPASFRAGGSFYIIPNGQNGGAPITVEYGTQIKFVPIVLGNGRIHLEVESTISDIDPSLPVEYQPALKDRSAKTGAELQAGQTLAIAGLVQTRTEAYNAGLPWISEVPYLGAAFRKVKEQTNEIELLIMVTPELVEALDANEVPPCGPGMQTTSPSDWELFMKGHLEVPKNCPANCAGDCPHGNGGPDAPPPDGMILGPGERIPTPQPADSAGRPAQTNRRTSAASKAKSSANEMAFREPVLGTKAAGPYSRYTPSKLNSPAAESPTSAQNGPPGFIGPVGYDIVK